MSSKSYNYSRSHKPQIKLKIYRVEGGIIFQPQYLPCFNASFQRVPIITAKGFQGKREEDEEFHVT